MNNHILENLARTVHISDKKLKKIKNVKDKLNFIDICIEEINVLLDIFHIQKQEIKKEGIKNIQKYL